MERQGGGIEEAAEDHDEECVGTRRPNESVVSFFARAGTRGSWPPSTDLSSRGGHILDAKVHGERDPAGGLAAVKRNAGQGGGETHSDFFLRSLFPGPWGHGNRLKSMGRKVWESGDFCVTGGVGRPDYRGVKQKMEK